MAQETWSDSDKAKDVLGNAKAIDNNFDEVYAELAGLVAGTMQLVLDTTPQLGGMLDVNGKAIGDGTLELLKFSETGSAVNELTIKNAATGDPPEIQATGDDANIDITLTPKGVGKVNITNMADDADVSFTALAVADLNDSATPSVLTTAETRNKLISNYKSSGADHIFTMPAAHTKGNVIFIIGDEFQVDIEPDTGDLFYLNGTAMAANEHIQNTADTLGQTITGICANINGTLRWMFYSSDIDWVEETP